MDPARELAKWLIFGGLILVAFGGLFFRQPSPAAPRASARRYRHPRPARLVLFSDCDQHPAERRAYAPDVAGLLFPEMNFPKGNSLAEFVAKLCPW